MRTSFQVARVFGIPIRVHITLLFTLFMFMQEFGLVWGLPVALGFVLSIVLHELGHSLVAIRQGCRVRRIDLLFIGGAAQMESLPSKPMEEFLMALAGPAVSFGLGIGMIRLGRHVPLPPLVGDWNLIEFLGGMNIGLLIFNLLPAFPMDGGRLLRALLARKMGRLRATFVAARLGRVLAIFLGLSAYFGLRPVISPRSWTLVAIAFFVFIAAGHEYEIVRREEQARSGGWPFGGFGPPPGGGGEPDENGPSDDETAIVGPPPYRREPPTRVEVRPAEEENPFRRFFR